VPAHGTLFDISELFPQKRRALEAYQSQLVYIDLVGLCENRDRAATVNIDIRGVTHAELFADLRPARLPGALALAESLQQLLLGGDA
jgi:hypothetical protein